jgi:DNA-binding response OmpR family regulator
MSTRRILIVDDQPDIIDVVRIAFDVTCEWDLLACHSLDEAIAAESTRTAEAALLDLSVTEGEPAAAVERLRAATGGAPVLLLTASSLTTSEVRRTGAAGLVPKPFEPMTLADEIAGLLGWS